MKYFIIHCSSLPVFTAKFNKFKCKSRWHKLETSLTLLLNLQKRYSDSSLNTSACLSCFKNLLHQIFSPLSKTHSPLFLFSYLIFLRNVQDDPSKHTYPLATTPTHYINTWKQNKYSTFLHSTFPSQCLHHESSSYSSLQGWSLPLPNLR